MSMTKRYLDPALEHPRIGLFDVLDRNLLDLGQDAVFGTKIEQFLSFLDSADQRTGKMAADADQISNRRRWMRVCWDSDQRHGAFALEQHGVGIQVMGDSERVQDKAKAVDVVCHLFGVT